MKTVGAELTELETPGWACNVDAEAGTPLPRRIPKPRAAVAKLYNVARLHIIFIKQKDTWKIPKTASAHWETVPISRISCA